MSEARVSKGDASRHSPMASTQPACSRAWPSLTVGLLTRTLLSPGFAPASDVVIHAELERVGTQSERLNFPLALITDPAVDQLWGEDISF